MKHTCRWRESSPGGKRNGSGVFEVVFGFDEW